ncbi:hypothetical protein AVEN_175582-1 [Araneus ventricosus]|uniref:Uncharacterized protein n=2 Tax=Araneus ventricosus TaxID=182803 RepID=A0A4Y2I4H1_ARAVE|nr:hypothetical protein AVEN_175582-1 [Araneus ventricosus]
MELRETLDIIYSLILLSLCPNMEPHDGYFGINLVILNPCQKTRTTPDLSLEDFTAADAILVTYSVTDVASFRKATHCLTMMRDLANKQPVTSLPLGPGLRSKAVILVGNKSDLARVRTVTTENGRSVASKYDVKFIETSVTIHHNVDELLVGALSQVRLKARQAAALSCRHHAKFTSRAKNLWNRLLQKCDLRFHSCDNLHRL